MSYNYDQTNDGTVTFIAGGDITLTPGVSSINHLDGDCKVSGNLEVSGTTTTTSVSSLLVSDNYLHANTGYTTPSGQSGGSTIRYLPIATTDTVNGAFVAGITATSNPTVITTGNAFSVNDIIAIDGANDLDNDGLYEVLTHSGNTLTIRGIGLTSTVEDFTKNQFVADTTVAGSITKVTLAVIRANTTGVWEIGNGSTTALIFEPVAFSNATITDHRIIRGDVSGKIQDTGMTVDDSDNVTGMASLTTSGTILSLDATGAAHLKSSGNSATMEGVTIVVDSTSGTLDIDAKGGALTIDADGSNAISVGAGSGTGTINIGTGSAATLNIGTGSTERAIAIGNTTNNTSINMNSGGTGDITIDSDDTLLLDSDGVLELNSSSGTINIGNDNVTGAVNLGTVGARTVTVGSITTTATTVIRGGTGTGITIDATGTGTIGMGTGAGTGNIDIGTVGSGVTTAIGNISGASSVTLNSGTSGVTIVATGAGGVDIDAGASGTIGLNAIGISQAEDITGVHDITNTGGGTIVMTGLTSGSCTIQTASIAGATTFQVPPDNGTNLYVLQTNGSGITSWVPQSNTMNWESSDFLNSTETGWSITTLAPSIVDPLLNMVHVREFVTGTTSAVGFQFLIPTGTTDLTFTLVWRPSSTNAGTVFWDIYARQFISGSAITADTWDTSEQISHAAAPGTVNITKVTSAALTLTNLSITAAELAYFQLVRDVTDTFTGSGYVLSLSVVAL